MHRRLMGIVPIFIILLLFIAPSCALTMEVTGDTQGKIVAVTLDREAFTSFTLNNATPIYAYGSEVQFIPAQTGSLTISALCGADKIEKTITIKKSGGGSGGDGDDDPSKWRTVTVSSGTVSITTHDSKKTYSVNRLTVLGILDASGVPYTTTDKEWGGDGLFVDSVDGKKNVFPEGWMYQINGAPGGPVEFHPVTDGDEIVWYYSRSMSDTPESSDRCIYLKVHIAGENSGGGSEEKQEENPIIRNCSVSGKASSVLTLPAGVTISDTGSGRVFTLDTRMAADAGEEIRYEKNIVIITYGAFELNIHLKDLNDSNGIVTGVIEEVTVRAAPVYREIEGVGSVSSSFLAGLNIVPAGASIDMTLSGNISKDLRNTFTLCALDDDRRSVSAIAYVMVVNTGMLRDGTDIGTATVIMTVPPDWVEAHGGTDAVVILHQRRDGSVEALETRFVGYDTSGNMRFEADSPGGLSIFALVASQEDEVIKGTPSPALYGPVDGTGSPAVPPSKQAVWIFYAIGLILLVGGVSGIAYWYFRKKDEPSENKE